MYIFKYSTKRLFPFHLAIIFTMIWLLIILVQGEMVRYTASEVNLTEFAEKRKAAQASQDRSDSPGTDSKSPNGLSSRRKVSISGYVGTRSNTYTETWLDLPITNVTMNIPSS